MGLQSMSRNSDGRLLHTVGPETGKNASSKLRWTISAAFKYGVGARWATSTGINLGAADPYSNVEPSVQFTYKADGRLFYTVGP